MNRDKISLILVITLLIANVALTAVVITRSLSAQNQRLTMERKLDRFECILYIPREERSPEVAIQRCGPK